MVKKNLKKILAGLGLLALFININSYGWEHEVAFGYGSGEEVEETYNNNGFELSGKLYKFPKIDQNLIATIDGTLGQWHSEDPDNSNNLTTAALSLGLRGYLFNPAVYTIRPYIGASFGPTYLSSEQFGEQVQGTHFAFQSQLGLGTEIGNQKHSVDLNFHMDHFCNAGIFTPNEGYDILYIFSIGYQF